MTGLVVPGGGLGLRAEWGLGWQAAGRVGPSVCVGGGGLGGAGWVVRGAWRWKGQVGPGGGWAGWVGGWAGMGWLK